jgi:hypothetical protein
MIRASPSGISIWIDLEVLKLENQASLIEPAFAFPVEE